MGVTRVLVIPLLAYYASASPTSQQHSLAAPASSISHHVEILDADHVRVNGRTYIAVDSSSRRLQSQPAPGPSPSPSHEFEGSEPEKDCAPEKGLTPDDGADFWIAVGCTLGCVCTAALAAGLTLGLLSIDELQLEIYCSPDADDWQDEANWGSMERKVAEDMKQQQAYARRIYPLVKPHSEALQAEEAATALEAAKERGDAESTVKAEEALKQAKRKMSCWSNEPHHLLMVTLLLMNSCANEALPIFLDKLVPSPLMAVLLSVTVVLIVGEILPTAVFTGEHQLRLAACLAPLVYTCKIIFVPVSWPIAMILDRLLGADHGSHFNRAEIVTLAKIHSKDSRERNESHRTQTDLKGSATLQDVDDLNQALASTEVDMVRGVLNLREQKIEDHYTRLEEVQMVSMEDRLDENTMSDMLAHGHSRVPVYDTTRDNIRGILLIKRLIHQVPDEARKIKTLEGAFRKPMFVSPSDNLQQLLALFRDGKAHLALVCEDPNDSRKRFTDSVRLHGGDVLGIITIEHVLEFITQIQIEDETDSADRVKHDLAMAITLSRRLPKLKQLIKEAKRVDAMGALRASTEGASAGLHWNLGRSEGTTPEHITRTGSMGRLFDPSPRDTSAAANETDNSSKKTKGASSDGKNAPQSMTLMTNSLPSDTCDTPLLSFGGSNMTAP